MKIKEIIVVEGRDDTTAVQQAVRADTIETGGSALNSATLKQIDLAQERRGVIIFTDPDYQGERLRNMISRSITGCKHAFLPKEKARSKQGKIGVEHASAADIQQALKQIRPEVDAGREAIPWSLLVEYGFVGDSGAKELRRRMGEHLGIGQTNAKQFHKRLQKFCITPAEFEQAYQRVLEEAESDA